MSKFNNPLTSQPRGIGPLATVDSPGIKTHEGATGFNRDSKTELFLLAVSNMVAEDTFYENAAVRDARYESLIHTVAVEDFPWLSRLLTWLRTEGNLRTAALVGAVEAVRARLATGAISEGADAYLWTNRALINAVCQRADEPGEIVAYWYSKYGKSIPMPIKRGIADAALRLYNERSLLKWDSSRRGVAFGDVVDLTHPKADNKWLSDVLRYAMDKHGRNEIPDSLRLIKTHQSLMTWGSESDYAARLDLLTSEEGSVSLRDAGMTWESVAGWLQGPMTATVWESIIPSMGYMALIRNLRNFDEAGVSDSVAESVCSRISDPEQVAKSRQLPFRFWSAYKHAPSLRWAHALEKAITLSLSNIPSLSGNTLILIDQSPSMFPGYDYMFSRTSKSDISRAEQAAVFGSALALRAENATLVEFGGTSREISVSKGGSILKLIEKFREINATNIPAAVKNHYSGHDRVIIVTDEQTRPGFLGSNWSGETMISELIPNHVPLYMWNMAGYMTGAMATGRNRHLLGGLSDHAFSLIPVLESGLNGHFPWDKKISTN